MKCVRRLLALAAVFVMVITMGAGAIQAAELPDTYPDLTKISTSELFQQEQRDYYVYFYMERCPYCNEVKSAINEFAKTENIYGIDYAIVGNRVNGYDWAQAAVKYNKKIGYLTAEGDREFLPGESEEKYMNSTQINKYGKVIRYQITEINESNVNAFAGASVGDIYAEVLTPEINYSIVSDPADLIIAGVPTLLHITDNKIDEFYFDSVEISALLAGKR